MRSTRGVSRLRGPVPVAAAPLWPVAVSRRRFAAPLRPGARLTASVGASSLEGV